MHELRGDLEVVWVTGLSRSGRNSFIVPSFMNIGVFTLVGRTEFTPNEVLTEFHGEGTHQADHPVFGSFIEEALRMQNPTKVDFRLARKTATLGGVHIPAGTVMMLCLGAANRDPRKFEKPNEFQASRKNICEHIAFGRGIHTCAGAPLARVEGQVTINRLLDRTRDIRISEAKHGLPPNREYRYESMFLLRGLKELHIEFTQAD